MATEIAAGQARTIVTSNATTQIKATPGKLAKMIVWGVGTAWVIDVYDHASANTNPVYQWLTAGGAIVADLQIPMIYGIRVVTSGTTAGSVTIVWS